ncbi:nicotinate-nucleotide diphosphorylase (carboxylating) [Anaplasma marginale]|uniref:carboxylating nicotinate-nucleotide diphosphorylase n=1 Tax=Anaplasma marginale TaxID=770 RepID=UPI000E57E486|nr:carboxylating nicotinate-nucleotide diphosphorylase [Anaplasma marginale]AXW84462.1 nicotinate-nucleotide diphosphorylase (carboxylating) [Anaplasma marginale]AXW85395.1 nicotinate-nucleotide diphosphorylase (carboxylating) [Anaplasma marginale]KAA8472864.1 carboxylating nicotinate-nucleotide diphosphorylase [Anaplasma marginale]KAB0451149.1 carboxylating nicotinate-nucleotide diphosphorylase [Anaplasma marginale]
MFEEIIRSAIMEDLGEQGDITTNCIFEKEEVNFSIISKEPMMVSGIVAVKEIFEIFSKKINFTILECDGNNIQSGTVIVKGYGPASEILSIERVLLNFLQRASSISSRTRDFVSKVAGTKAKIRSTRKTSPGLRNFDLYAVRVGGGESYRDGLYNGIMVKDNHIVGCGSITECVSRIRRKLGDVFITVECDSKLQVEESIKSSVNLIMLDNMGVSDIKDSIKMIGNSAIVEVSGGVNIENIREIASLGVDYISIGSITHSFTCKDISLEVFK